MNRSIAAESDGKVARTRASQGCLRALTRRGSLPALVGALATLLPTFLPLTALAQTPAQEFKAPDSADVAGLAARRGDPSSTQSTSSSDAQQIGADRARGSSGVADRSVGAGNSKETQADAKANPDQAAQAKASKRLVGSGSPAPDDANGTPTPDPPVEKDVIAPGEAGDKTGASSQSISVPKGAGTIEGMGESFSTQLSTGVATFNVPFALPKARGAAQPSLGLSYSSGSGWGIAGMGWDLGVPFIARQTDRGTPRYNENEGTGFQADQDRFVFNGGQELVPICTVGGTFPTLTCTGALTGEEMPPWSSGYQYFRARVEGSFLRFFWSPSHLTWRVQDKTGVTLELGVPLDGTGNRSGLEANPAKPQQVFRWNLVRQYDTQGSANPSSGSPAPNNVVVYQYTQQGGAAYLTDIYDTPPSAAPTTTDLTRFAHHAHIEYADRTDPTTSYRSGWLIERRKRIARVDVSSKTFNGSDTQLRRQLRRYYLSYRPGQHASLLESVLVEGRCGSGEDLTSSAPSESATGALAPSSCPRLPAMTFEYTHVTPYTTSGATGSADLFGYEGFDERV
ncbi:MAG TPA: SpvB/TcaC N-terminal domain-containing protein, partial [Gemmatimonadaceae bacterium]|nr:SpvB/TcaC N-terminal domain-containing protein [Gemmatimonadaceae bacterium]